MLYGPVAMPATTPDPVRSRAARRRWAAATPEQRRANTARAVVAATEQRRQALALYRALQASGVTLRLDQAASEGS